MTAAAWGGAAAGLGRARPRRRRKEEEEEGEGDEEEGCGQGALPCGRLSAGGGRGEGRWGQPACCPSHNVKTKVSSF